MNFFYIVSMMLLALVEESIYSSYV